MKLLVTGINSGLGKFLHRYFQSDGLSRHDEIPDREYDVIIHCAVNSTKDINNSNITQYVDDNVMLTSRLLSLKCAKFIYMSTIDVYPKISLKSWSENDELKWDAHAPQLSIYTITKLVSEALVMKSDNWVILRCSTLLNKYSRKHTVMKILEGDHPRVFVNSRSEYNCVLASDIAKFIKLSWEKNFQGVYNASSNINVQVIDIADMFNKDVVFGDYFYTPGNIDNSKICAATDVFNKSTENCIIQFNEELNT